MNLSDRLRQAAAECSGWNGEDTPPFTEWSDLMDEAATFIDAPRLEDPGYLRAGGPWTSRAERFEATKQWVLDEHGETLRRLGEE